MEQRDIDSPTDGQPAVVGGYVVGERLERRPAADVYDASHAETGAPRLFFVLRPRAMEDAPLVHRVVCEADAARWLRHPTAARLEACGDTPSRRLYVAVERAPGRPLGAVVAEGGPLTLRRVVRLASRLVEALDEAHAVGLAHGRLTPAAVFLGAADDQGRELVTLAGLGTAALLDDVADADRPYVSPEQLAGGAAEVRSDVFGLASLLAYAIDGVAPAPVDPSPEAAARAGATAVPGASRAAAAVLAAARAADPAARPASVKALWEDLLTALVAEDAASSAAAVTRPLATVAAGAPAAGHLPLLTHPSGPSTGPTPTLDLDALDALDALDLDTLALELLPSLAAAAEREPAPAVVARVPAAPPAATAPRAPKAPIAPAASLPPAAPALRHPARERGYVPDAWDASRYVPTAAELATAARATTTPEPARPRRPVDPRVWWLAPAAVALAMGWPVVHAARQQAEATRAAHQALAERQARATRDSIARTDAEAAERLRRDMPWTRGAGSGDVAGLDTLRLPVLPTVDVPLVDAMPPDRFPQPPVVRPEEFAPLVRLPNGAS